MVRLAWALFVVVAVCALAWACSNGAVDVTACREIEYARCARAPACNVDLDTMEQHSSSETYVGACQQFYSIACLHGLATSVVPTSTQLTACIAAINDDGACEAGTVASPQDASACAWLVPPVPVVVDTGIDVAAEAEAGQDAAPDAGM